MPERPRFLDDLAGIAGGAVSALTGMRDEVESLVRARIDEALRRLDVVRREEFDAAMDMAAAARAGQEAAEARLDALEARLAALETPHPATPAAPPAAESAPPPAAPPATTVAED